jgi:SAM-dependent methyltransferase
MNPVKMNDRAIGDIDAALISNMPWKVKVIADAVVNHFVHQTAAARYAAARPFFHPIVIDHLVRKTGRSRFGRALDVACGTGQSAQALASIADSVDAIDVSSEMLQQAEQSDRIRYQISPAEALPFAANAFDLVTVGMAFHWFDQPAFLRQAARVLKQDGWLVIYNNGFNGEMAENPKFRAWAWEAYPKRFPTPARRSVGVSAQLVSPYDLESVGQETFENPTPMRAEQLVAYLLTQTNVIAAVEEGKTSIADAADWIGNGIRPFFNDATRTMKFSGTIWYIRPTAPGARGA